MKEPKNYKDLKWREYPKEKPTAENGDYLCLRKMSKHSKFVGLTQEFYSNTQYETHNMRTTSDSLWSKGNPNRKIGGEVVYWMPLPDAPK